MPGRKPKCLRVRWTDRSLSSNETLPVKLERFDHPLASQRVNGRASLGVRMVGGRSRVAVLEQAGAAKIRLPASAGDPLEAILINTAGGMTGGDRLDWTISAGKGASVVATTQACEKAYRSAQGEAAVSTRLTVARGGHIAWLPQETIVYDRSALTRRIDADLEAGATALICEATIFGRQAMGETVGHASFRDAWRVRVAGRLVHAENLALTGEVGALLNRKAILDGATAMATVLLVSPGAETCLDRARSIAGEQGGVSAWRVGGQDDAGIGKLLARLVAKDGYDLRRRLVPLLELLNGQAPLPKVWSL